MGGREQRLLASSDAIVFSERFDLLIHALAQLPEEVSLTLVGRGPGLPLLKLLGEAYGILERVSFEPEGQSKSGRLVYPSVRNFCHAPIRPAASLGDPVLFDPDGTISDPCSVDTFGTLVERLAPNGASSPMTVVPDPRLDGQNITVVTNVPMHYRVPLFSRLAERLESAGARLHLVFVDGARNNRSWNVPGEMRFDHSMLPSRTLSLDSAGFLIPTGLVRSLKAAKASVILVGGFSPLVVGGVAAYARRNRVPFGLWSGEIGWSRTGQSFARLPLRKWMARSAQFALVYGYAAGEYLTRLAPGMPLIYCRNTSPHTSRGARTADRRPVELLALGQLFPWKGLDLLIDALALKPDLDCRLTIAGTGPLQKDLADRAACDSRVRFPGAITSNRVPALLTGGDVFLFPSHEDMFGLALVEAMGAGLAVAASKSTGAVSDLVIDGVNGMVVCPQSPEAWAEAIGRLVDDRAYRERLAAAGASTVRRRWTLEHSVNAWVAGLNLAVRSAS